MKKKRSEATEKFERSLVIPSGNERYVLRLYVTGMTRRSMEALVALKAVCKKHLEGRYELEVIDIYQHPRLAKDEQITAVPMLVKRLPLPLRRLIGNLADEQRLLLGLDLRRDESRTPSQA